MVVWGRFLVASDFEERADPCRLVRQVKEFYG
jgi:hypothetical protein